MKNLTTLIFAFILFASCSATKNAETAGNKYKPEITDIESPGPSMVTGYVKNELGEDMPFVKVMLIQNGVVVLGAVTDIDGNFKIENVSEGVYSLEVNSIGYDPILIEKFEVKASKKVNFKMIEAEQPQIITLKPVIYLYPEETMDISVELKYKGKLTHTYPKYPVKNGWKVKAQPDGTLMGENGMEYYALFWEGKPTEDIKPQNGFVVSGKKTVTFLEEKLTELGLNRREANEFIMFWLPQMENNPFNLIHFSSDAYEELAELNITPAPETIIRVMMITKPLSHKIDFPLQDITPLKKSRNGYTVVEWGGSFWPKDLPRSL